ncbi:Hypothetical protein I596_1252 [Dokdonella koreensis DS-123]|uniref:Uncharacterized protein n=1 Tax=Dokdonella koreensis DS-123 TaxID=1300342 RepID=A0A167GRF1_9GAMM|nr:Hypothetical protein I596_1252 [Dokdonella koreensis DS-123]
MRNHQTDAERDLLRNGQGTVRQEPGGHVGAPLPPQHRRGPGDSRQRRRRW